VRLARLVDEEIVEQRADAAQPDRFHCRPAPVTDQPARGHLLRTMDRGGTGGFEGELWGSR